VAAVVLYKDNQAHEVDKLQHGTVVMVVCRVAGGSATSYYDSGNGGALAFLKQRLRSMLVFEVFVGRGGYGADNGGSGAGGAVRIIWPSTSSFSNINAGIDRRLVTSITIGTTDFSQGENDGICWLLMVVMWLV